MSSKRKNEINDQQDLFCRVYARTLSVSKAVKESNYTVAYGYKLLEKRHICDRIESYAHEAGEKLKTEHEQILQEAAALAFSDLSEVAGIRSIDDLKHLPIHVRHAVRKIKCKLEYGTVHVMPANEKIKEQQQGLSLIHEDVKDVEESRGIVGAEIEIQMHDKHQSLRLLAMAKNLIGANQKDDDDDDDDYIFTGCDVHVLEEKQ